MKIKPTFNLFVYALIALFALLNYALMLGTLELITGGFPVLPSLDLLRAEASFFLFVGFFSACYLSPVPKLLWFRRVLVLMLLSMLLLLAHISTVVAQLTSEAGPMHKVLFYVNYLHKPWLNDQSFQLFILFILPGLLVLFALVVYWFCVRSSIQSAEQSPRFFRNFVLAWVFLLVGFLPPMQTELPYSLSHNTLLYLLKSGYMPQEDVVEYDEQAAYQDWKVEEGRGNQKNIVFIILESTQYKAIQLGGKNDAFPGLTPFLAELSAQSVVFDQAYGTVPHTSKALVGIHCGLLPVLDLPIYESIYGLPVKCFPELLVERGYQNVFMQAATDKYENRRELLTQFGYQEVMSAEDFKGSDQVRSNPLGFEDTVLLGAVDDWLKQKEDKPYQMSLLTLTSHHPYETPPSFKTKAYVDAPLENAYLNSIAYLDQFLSKLFNVFKAQDDYQDTLFVFISDHGEAFGEHGEQMHNNVAYNEVARVFFMIFDPSQGLVAARNQGTVSQLQVLPSTMDLLGFSMGPSEFNSVLKEQGRAFGSCYERFMCFFYADNDYKYIYNFREKQPELYDIKNDPRELQDLSKEKPERVLAMHRVLMNYYTQHQSAIHNYYLRENPNYEKEIAKTVLYSIDDMRNSLDAVWED